ncbi:hypothetical protein NKR19_g8595 [Coniochaeta hoffmannii]|uniref:Aquaporin-like protein n=1 Tax=Coniochaeta hoffmannii TaxID=91930 RepID=A0AA38R5T7_9PEZI|nr:hypothetical protein NKR19_g8595 [Coniochaeta hoffmannii]
MVLSTVPLLAQQGIEPTPMSFPWYLRSQYFIDGWTNTSIWRAALVELVATSLQVYLSGQIRITLMNYQIIQLATYVGIYASLLLAIFIYATAPASGGHLNPTITSSGHLWQEACCWDLGAENVPSHIFRVLLQVLNAVN